MPAWILPAAMTAFQGGMQMYGQHRQNVANKELAKDQREWNERMWHMQNKYNHPLEQMKRLKEGGLNPRMIYGSGASSAVGTAGDVKGYDRAEHESVTKGIDAFSNFYNFKQLAAQTDNTEANTAVANQEALIKSQELISKAVKAEVDQKTKQDLIRMAHQNYRKAFFDADRADAIAHQSWYDTEYKRDTLGDRKKLVSQQLTNAILSGDLRRIEKNLNELGIQKHDSYFIRMMAQSKKGRAQLRSLAESGLLPLLLGVSALPIPKMPIKGFR